MEKRQMFESEVVTRFSFYFHGRLPSLPMPRTERVCDSRRSAVGCQMPYLHAMQTVAGTVRVSQRFARLKLQLPPEFFLLSFKTFPLLACRKPATARMKDFESLRDELLWKGFGYGVTAVNPSRIAVRLFLSLCKWKFFFRSCSDRKAVWPDRVFRTCSWWSFSLLILIRLFLSLIYTLMAHGGNVVLLGLCDF